MSRDVLSNQKPDNEEQAIEYLRKAGLASAKKREGRIAAEGTVGSYIHMGGKVGVQNVGHHIGKGTAITLGILAVIPAILIPVVATRGNNSAPPPPNTTCKPNSPACG